MKNNIFKENSRSISNACDYLTNNEVIAIKAETVYGLAADAGNRISISKVYKLKKRPIYNPLIIHVNSIDMAKEFAIFNNDAEVLARRYWPGPLTLILKRRKIKIVHNDAVAGLDTVAVRMPNSKIFLKIISFLKKPLAAPSANKSGYISSTNANHVRDCFGHKVKMIIDSGKSNLGLESTIIDTTKKPYLIRRLGIISKKEIFDSTGLKVLLKSDIGNSKKPNSPGQLKKHYSPKTPIILNVKKPGKDDAFLSFGKQVSRYPSSLNLSTKGDLNEAASNLFDYLRRLDKLKKNKIAVFPVPSNGIGKVINERLKRASVKND